MENVLQQILQEIKEIKESNKAMNQRFDSIEHRLDSIELEQHQIKQAVFETNDKITQLQSFQESQHRVIELLSARSIQQEADLKKIQ
ncbi:hypothetical protein [Lysinibacillus piscis]|uniref:Uncharacterized protein n=1 Tax=Lysinibacillus piscis TaxID=2518931 RepID=A0ABQ5NHV9_9BACI|nr:hypothetical protein [Lysinibacillus sp. KH24]GLC87869.1 hypothetical protein LYSBPC_09960 [Lysinibacillus sp. KH24]